MLLHRFHLDKLAFNPSASFVSNLWNCNFFWTLPDTPSGVSIFFCLEMESINASELERERSFALADKVKIRDIEKLSKQPLYIPTSVMDMVWMTQNLSATISLCFGKNRYLYPSSRTGRTTCTKIDSFTPVSKLQTRHFLQKFY
jgi:hypothetical protein